MHSVSSRNRIWVPHHWSHLQRTQGMPEHKKLSMIERDQPGTHWNSKTVMTLKTLKITLNGNKK